MKKIIHLTLFLALIAAIAGGALGLANGITKPIIEKNELAAEADTLKVIYPDVDDFKLVEVKGSSKTIEKIFNAEGKGYIFKMKVTGYKDGTSFLVAFDAKGNIADYVTISNGDTQGIGSKVLEEPFRDSLKGKAATGKLDTITGATVTTKPIIDGIQEAAKYLADNLK